ncbi:flavoprotein [Streptomyces klenkii]|uniref:Flavoprotein n=1 Tax=Streptomyces klenkii TaxID=1420899 RepID=A0A3B0AMJ1_9ACTN|nr:flavoprotein [Streptomyces klenkii]RKN61920.1 flavoprotein [Streptomyces klenkii]
MTPPVLYLLGSAAPPVLYVDGVVRDAQARGWDVCVGLTPTAATWLENQLPQLEELTGRPVRVQPRRPGVSDGWPPADVTILAPATLHTVNSIALGLTLSWVSAYACEAIGKGWPLVVMPCVNSAYATHPQFGRSLEVLRGAGVEVLFGVGGFVPNPPGQGRPVEYPWHLALGAAERRAGRAP